MGNLSFVGDLTCAGDCGKHFAYIISLNPTTIQWDKYCHPYFTDKETEV